MCDYGMIYDDLLSLLERTKAECERAEAALRDVRRTLTAASALDPFAFRWIMSYIQDLAPWLPEHEPLLDGQRADKESVI